MRRIMGAQAPATTAGPIPNGMISAPLPERAQPLPERRERLSTMVRIQRRKPAITPRTAMIPVKPGSRLGAPIDPAIEQHATGEEKSLNGLCRLLLEPSHSG